MVYKQDRFRDITVDEIIERIRESELYQFETRLDGSESININGRGHTQNQPKLWDGTIIGKFPEHSLHLVRTSLPTQHWDYYEVIEKNGGISVKRGVQRYMLNHDLIRREIVEIVGAIPSFVGNRTHYRHYHTCYDRLTPEKEAVMERIRITVDRLFEVVEP